ncbi:lysozyme inhibitor LprI family protein [Roseovarius sp. CAU 1744]|uniref:lysozyme inhibitor LprI family protein n=1 Tax=Roseovarius sp. CAU 1744 TaxID=3140368 RepID=UPI00325A5DF2
MKLLTLALVFLAGSASAQDLVFSPAQTESCLASSAPEQQRLCFGLSAQACMSATPGGHTTVGMAGCLDAERQYWDNRLNAAYQSRMAQAKAVDAEMAELGATVSSQADALREMQRAWIPFRDGKCGFEYSQWGGGTGGGPAITACLMNETGEQTLYLENSGLGR